MKTKALVTNAMLAAMCAVLGYISLDFGNLKFTFESLPIIVGALLFGPVSGMAVGGIGTLIYQLLRYGVSATTLLWMLPYIICGFLVGFYAKSKDFRLGRVEIIILIVINELLITALNTGVMYIDSIIYGYYSYVYIFGTLIPRIIICAAKAVVYGLIMPGLLSVIQKSLKKEYIKTGSD